MTADFLGTFKLGEPQPLKAAFRGTEYPGEILLADAWRPELGEIAKEDVHFRIVVFTKYQPVPDIADRRIACCIPGHAIREGKGVYKTKRKEPWSKQTALYAQGQICTKERLAIDAGEVFSTGDIAAGFHIIAAALLSNAYTAMPQSFTPLSDLESEVLAVKAYLDGVVLRESDSELAMDRVSILEQLTLDNLLPNLHLWPSLKALFDWFQSRYRAIYAAHHHDYHKEMASFHLVLDDSKPEVDALRRLNSIIELGEPVGEELVNEYEQLLARVSPCPVTEVSMELEPTCSQCGLVLTAEPPQKEVERFLHRLRQALKQQHRRLSSEAVRQILAQSGERRIDQFIKVVQTSELSPLINLLDDELIDFLRQLLQEAHIDIPWRPTFAELTERFPSLEEGDIDAAAAEFAELLRKAFAKAKREHPGKRVRLSFKE